MKTLQLYVCEICGTRYESEDECRRCEESHKAPIRIVKEQYRSLKYDGDKYPYPISILFEMSDGENLWYRLHGKEQNR